MTGKIGPEAVAFDALQQGKQAPALASRSEKCGDISTEEGQSDFVEMIAEWGHNHMRASIVQESTEVGRV